MNVEWVPMRWPGSWKTASGLSLIKGGPVNCLLFEKNADVGSVEAEAKRAGLQVARIDSPPAGVNLVKGEWPGIQRSRKSTGDSTDSGPTGVPWVDSNGWKIRLEAARHLDKSIWMDAPPKGPRVFPGSYQLAIADAEAHGGRWVISLDDELAAGLADARPESLDTWKRITAAAAFFGRHRQWSDYVSEAVVGVVSSFAGDNEFLSQELLNLIARTNQQYRILLKDGVSQASLRGLRAVIYADGDAPAPELRTRILTFVRGGGLLITSSKWGALPGTTAGRDEHPLYSSRVLGTGRIAIAKSDFDDPYLLARDSALLISHRYELLRFWNGGAVGSYLTVSPDRARTVAHLLFYANRGPDDASVRIVGRYRTANLWTLDRPEPRPLRIQLEKDAVELHLPGVSQYAAVELEV